MNKILFNEQNKLRNGWWIAIFIGLIAITRPLYGPTKDAVLAIGLDESWIEPLSFLFILAVTWICCRLRGHGLINVGLGINTKWFGLLQLGLLFSLVQITLLVSVIWISGGVVFDYNPERSIEAMIFGLYVFLFAALMEELLFRGFIFQRLLDGIGVWPAQLGMALLFSVSHWSNPDMEGETLIWASLDIGLGAILWGLAFIRTQSLALPIGMHLGWNWALGSVYGMGVSGYEHQGWLQPVLQDAPLWLTGGSFGPEASVVAVVVDILGIIVLWRWKGIEKKPTAAQPSMA